MRRENDRVYGDESIHRDLFSVWFRAWNRHRWVPASDETDLSRKPNVCEEQKNGTFH
jgi:hypothetical protein